MQFDLTGKVALVTGGTRGLGRVIAAALVDQGCKVMVTARNEPDSLDKGLAFHQADIRDAEAVEKLVDTTLSKFGGIDILVNNAGGSPASDAATASPRFADAIMGLNLMAPYYLSRACHPHLTKSDNGSIINIGSVAGIRPAPGTAIYGAAKAGLMSLTQSLAQEWGKDGIRVNGIIVGLAETENAEATYGNSDAQAAVAASLPLGRMCRGDDVAKAVCYLASPAAEYVSGARLNVDGGGEKPYFLDLVKGTKVAGVQSLGYIVIETTDMANWAAYLTNIVGAMPGGSGEDGAALYRLDERAARFRIIESDTDRFAAAGWELADADAFEEMVEDLQAAGHDVEIGDATSRGVAGLALSTDPAGNSFEIFYGAADADTSFASPAGVSKFVTGDLGMGHVVYGTLAFDETRSFYGEVMGFGESDIPEIEVGPPGTPKMGTCFMHAATGRHHSVALLQMPEPPTGCVHIMVEAGELSDVEAGYERMQAAEIPVSATLGKHTNDQVTSFYMQSPAGFDVEFGWGGLVVDPATWEATAHTKMDEWGHEWAWQKAAAEEANG